MRLLGRERELQVLAQACDAAIGGRGQLFLVVGEPGIGKTQLADEVAARAGARGMRVAWGRAWETGGAPPFYPWTEVLDELGGPSLDASRPSRGGDGANADAVRERFSMFDGVLRFLRTGSQAQPLLLVFDDLHAADVHSLELLHFVARGLRSRRIAILGTVRDVEARRGGIAEALASLGREANHLTLGALGVDDVGAMVERHLGHADARWTAELMARTEGNPLFVVEALRTLDQRGDLAWSGVLAVIASRIDGLDADATALLDAASVFGRVIVATPLAAALRASLDDVQRQLGDLCTRGVLRAHDDGTFVFSHALVRDTFYERIALHRRRELHVAIGAALVTLGARHASLAAHHLLAGLPLASPDEVVRASIAAADDARARRAPQEAVAVLERTLAALQGLGASELEILLALGWAATEAGARARGRQVFREASRRAAAIGDHALVARAALGQGAELVFGEVREELIATLRGAIDGVGDRPELRARLLARLAAALQPSTTPEEPVELARQAMAMAMDVVDPRVRAEVSSAAGSALVDFAPPRDRIPVSEELIRSARAIDDSVAELRGLTRLATDWLELGDLVRAEGVIEARAELAATIGHPRYLWQTPLLRSMLAMPRGAFATCAEAVEEATAIGQEADDVNAAHVVAMHRFWLFQIRGDADGLRAHVPEVLRAMTRMPEPAQHHALVHAVVHAREGDAARARTALAGIGDGARMRAPMMLATIAEVALRADDAGRFEDLLARLAPARGRYTAWGPFGFVCGPPYDAVCGALAARLGRRDEAIASFAAALELARRSGAVASEAWVVRARAQHLGEPSSDHVAAAPTQPRADPVLAFSLRTQGADVVLEHRGRTTRLRPLRGLTMLARLVEQPGRQVHVLDLAAEPEDERVTADAGDAGEVIDARARQAYQQRIGELREQLDEAERFGDLGRSDRARQELEMLLEQLSAAVGLGGRARRVGSAAERARITVQRRVREAIRRIAEHEPELGKHLDWAIRTGTFCAYEPDGRRSAV